MTSNHMIYQTGIILTTAQQQRHQQQQQHQFILQQPPVLNNSQSMLWAPANYSSQLAMMSSSPNHIFLSQVRSVGLELKPQQQQQSQCQFLQQQQQLVLQQDTGLSSNQLTMMSSSPNHICLSPINMDMLTGQSQQQQQQQTLHFHNVTCRLSDADASDMDVSD